MRRVQKTASQELFQSTLPARGATFTGRGWIMLLPFQSTLPARGATASIGMLPMQKLFQSTLPARGATARHEYRGVCGNFNPRSPHGERREAMDYVEYLTAFQSTLPARGATGRAVEYRPCGHISIHAPRTGSDCLSTKCSRPDSLFQSTLPARAATRARLRLQPCRIFQSTLPARGATAPARPGKAALPHFNPRSPHGERHSVPYRPRRADHFNPRSPHGERLDASRSFVIGRNISIHAPRTGSDCVRDGIADAGKHFNPRSPHGERLDAAGFFWSGRIFQSTLPARGATALNGAPVDFAASSIHAPRTGSDRSCPVHPPYRWQFQSTLPARGATH